MNEETLLQLGMLADAGDEGYMHVQYCDSDKFDSATFPGLQRVSTSGKRPEGMHLM